MDEFAHWLKAARIREGLTQEELGHRAGCSKSYISTLERNVGHSGTGVAITPDDDLVDRLADALNESRKTARLLAGYAPPAVCTETETEEEREAKRILRRLPPEKRTPYIRAMRTVADAMLVA